jgi:hypothetical protein
MVYGLCQNDLSPYYNDAKPVTIKPKATENVRADAMLLFCILLKEERRETQQ